MMKKRILIYSLIMFFLSVVECSFFARINFLPATPDLVLVAVTLIAIIDTKETALVCSIIGGVMTDAIGTTGIYLSPVLYLAAAVAICIVSKKMMPRYPSWIATFPVACLMRGAFTLFEIMLFGGNFVFGAVLRYIILPELICTVIFALPIYPIVRLCTLPFARRREMLR